jgi:hypothetical protein
MARKKRHRIKGKRRFGPVEQARLRARESLGTPQPTRAIPSKKHKLPKHKKELIEQELDSL